jgi:hypothetical protein
VLAVAICAGGLGASWASAAALSGPPGARLTAGAMPGHPQRVQFFARHKLPPQDRLYFNRIFSRKIHLGDRAQDTVILLGVVHKIVWYGHGYRACYFYDGGYVLCAWGKHIVAKGHER